ncbi:MAG: universal stress protein [Casimicrobiaceae bacterium]
MNARILCGYDGSAAAEKAFDFALALASAFKSELRVLAVAQLPEPPEDVETEALVESAQDHFEKLFVGLRAKAAAAGVTPGFEVSAGHPAEQILYHADSWNADHIVLGHRGKNAFRRWLMGSVSHRVISYAVCTVTVVR